MGRARTVVVTEIALAIGLVVAVAATSLIRRALGGGAMGLSPAGAAALAAAPAALWLLCFHLQDRRRPDRLRHVAGLFLLGALVAGPIAGFVASAFLAGAAAGWSPLAPTSIAAAIAVAALAEELAVYAVIRCTVYAGAEIDAPIDAIIYATAVALGVAAHAGYVELHAHGGSIDAATAAAHVAVLYFVYPAAAAALGHAIGRAKFASRSEDGRAAVLLAGIAAAAIVTGGARLVAERAERTGIALHPWRGAAVAAGLAAALFSAVAPLETRRWWRRGRARDDAGAAPAPRWRNRDLLLAIAGAVVIGGGALACRVASRAGTTRFHRLGLAVDVPAPWLRREGRSAPPSPLVAATDGRRTADASRHLELRVTYQSPSRPQSRIEIRIAALPAYRPLRGALALARAARYGARLWSRPTTLTTIAGRDWLRTRFEYAAEPFGGGSPAVTGAAEYATSDGGRLFVVTFEGRPGAVHALESRLAPTLAIAQRGQRNTGAGALTPVHGRRRGAEPPAVEAALPSAVLVMAADVVGDDIVPVASGSGAIVSARGAVLTNRHILADPRSGRLHDLFFIGRLGAAGDQPALVCAGRPDRGLLDKRVDLALIQCDLDFDGRPYSPKNWPAVALGRSGPVAPGERLWIIGFPSSGSGEVRVSSGQVAGRSGEAGGAGDAYVKTDAAVTPGISGGVALDQDGELIGTPTAFRVKVTGTGIAMIPASGVGLVRPIRFARALLGRDRAGWRPGPPPAIGTAPAAEAGAAGEGPAARGAAATANGRNRSGARPGALAPVTAEPQPPAAPATGRGSAQGSPKITVTSRVTDGADGAPVAGAVVVLLRHGARADRIASRLGALARAWTRTDPAGRFTFIVPLSPGGATYPLAVLAPGYRPLVLSPGIALRKGMPPLLTPWPALPLVRDGWIRH